MCWGIQVGVGWLPIIDELCSKIQQLIDNKSIDSFQFEEIKEKYGSLRITPYKYNKQIQMLINNAKYKAVRPK